MDAYLGVAEADITPVGSVETVGFGRADERSEGVLSPLRAVVSVWKRDGRACCLIGIDHIGFSYENANALRDRVGAMLGVGRESVMLCFSHTHAAPNDSVETAYARMAADRIADGVREAVAGLAPVWVGWGVAEADVAINRRPDAEAVDRRIGILKAVDPATGRVRLAVLRLTAHANALKENNRAVSPDYFGAVRARLPFPALLTQGASGNAAPRYYVPNPDVADPPRYYGLIPSENALNDMAKAVADAVLPAMDAIIARPVRQLSMYSRRVTLYADVPDDARARAIADEAKQYAGIDGRGWLAEVGRLRGLGVTQQREDVETQYFSVNEGCLCGVPNEIMMEFALRAAKLAGSELFFLGGYTNGCGGYFPTEAEYDLGGYEVHWSYLIYYPYYGRVGALRRESAGRLIEEAIRGYRL